MAGELRHGQQWLFVAGMEPGGIDDRLGHLAFGEGAQDGEQLEGVAVNDIRRVVLAASWPGKSAGAWKSTKRSP
jgi:hypothetical protein